MTFSPECAICHTSITSKFWVCSSCEQAYNLSGPFKAWPEWAKAMADEEQKRRRYEANWRQYTVLSLDELDMEQVAYGGDNTDPIAEKFSL